MGVREEKWNWHKQVLGIPSYIAGFIIIIGPLENNWWYLYLFLIGVVPAYSGLYDFLFTEAVKKISIRGLVNGVSVLSFQLVFWGAAMYFTIGGNK